MVLKSMVVPSWTVTAFMVQPPVQQIGRLAHGPVIGTDLFPN